MARRRTPRIAPGYKTEAELCEEIVAWARLGGCSVYPECGGWDLLLVVNETGEQIGVQAKLRASVKLLEQAVGGMGPRLREGPDIVALAIPTYDLDFDRVATALDMTLLVGAIIAPRGHADFRRWMRGARRRATARRCWVPEVEVALPAGVPSPRTLSPWKFGAARACARLRAGDALTRKEFADLGLRVDSWKARGWVARVASKPVTFRLRSEPEGGVPLPDIEFPEVVAALGLPDPLAQCYSPTRSDG